jgi:iron uptake system component EfeO
LHRPLSRVVIALATLAAVASCSSAGDGSTPTTAAGGTPGAARAGQVREIAVTISDAGCEPRLISATAGPTTFLVDNEESSKVTEFEVLRGDTILGEVENVIPGARKDFSITLEAGSFTTYCPNGEFEKGTLEVSDAPKGAAADGAARKKAVDTYLDYVKRQADELVARTGPFAAAVEAGDLATVKSTFAATRAPYEAIEPIAESFGDLDPAIDAREGDVPDAEWGGFHKIEQAAFAAGSLDGMGPVAGELVAHVRELRTKIDGVELEPAQIANGAVELLNEVSTSKITGEEDRYSHTDLSDFNHNLAGARAAFEAVKPLVEADHEDLAGELTTRFDAVQTALDGSRGTDPVGNGYALFADLDDTRTKALSAVVDALAEPLSQVAAIVIV